MAAVAMAQDEAVPETETDAEEGRLSKQELQAVYNFCELLPQLEHQGVVARNKDVR